MELLLLLALLPLAGFLFVAAERRRRRGLRQMGGERGEEQGLIRERRAEFFCLAWAAGLIILALARPTWREVWVDAPADGRDVVFLLDVSRSMLAADVLPDRLEVAKTAIRDCVAALEGDRVALVAFSGSASILCPLTSDLAFFHDKLDEAHPDFIPAGEVRVGGTRIGDAIRKTSEKLFTPERRGFQDLVLLSDGGDQESAPVETVDRLGHLGVYLIAIGIGDPVRGARIPAPSGAETEFVMHGGEEVWTRLESGGLETLAKACRQGGYLEAGTRVLPLGRIYPKLVEHLGRADLEDGDQYRKRQETFPLFLAFALLLLAPPVRRLGRRPAVVSAAFMGVLLFPGGVAEAAGPDPTRLFRQGCRQLEAKNHAGAAGSFSRAAEGFTDPERRALALYNAGLGSFLQADADETLDPQSALEYFGQAADTFRASLDMKPDLADARWNLELALVRKARVAGEIARKAEAPTDENEPSGEESPEDKESAEGDEGQTSEDSEGETSEEDADGEATPTNQSEGANALDLEANDLPPPTIEPEELLQQEAEQGDLRQKQRSNRYKPVEKDW